MGIRLISSQDKFNEYRNYLLTAITCILLLFSFIVINYLKSLSKLSCVLSSSAPSTYPVSSLLSAGNALLIFFTAHEGIAHLTFLRKCPCTHHVNCRYAAYQNVQLLINFSHENPKNSFVL